MSFKEILQMKEIILSSLAGVIVVAVFGLDLIVPVVLSHLVFCGYLGWRDARSELKSISDKIKNNDNDSEDG